MKSRLSRTLLLATALAVASSTAAAHDSWLQRGDDGALELTTGNRFPVGEVNQSPESVIAPGCTDGRRNMPLQPGATRADALVLQVPDSVAPPLACWLELAEASVELDPRLVQVYLDEIRPAAQVRERAARLQARGLAWRERYRKFARIEFSTPADAAAREQARRPLGHPLEIVVLGTDALAPNVPIDVQVLRDGRPLPGFSLELVSERSGLGIWRSTDAQGRVQHRLPFGGRWILRGTEVRPSEPDAWESRFVTLVLHLR